MPPTLQTPNGILQFFRATVTASELLAGASVIVSPAPGVGSYIVPLFILLNYKFKTTPYTPASGGQLVIGAGINSLNLPWAVCDQTSVIDASNDTVTTCFQASIGTPTPPSCSNGLTGGPFQESDIDNQPLCFYAESGNPTLGDGTIDVMTWYTVVQKAQGF